MSQAPRQQLVTWFVADIGDDGAPRARRSPPMYTRQEALAAWRQIREDFPQCVLVREEIKRYVEHEEVEA